ncbi:MAG TPA: hypothetical protein VLT58_18850 [Polyangia bacterium]|nr:hypothetical protein [Polyangia bacterium]
MSPARSISALALMAALAGCWKQAIGGPDKPVSTGTGGAGIDDGAGGSRQRFQITPTRNQLDLLFVIDDSGSAAAQQKLVAQLPVLVQALEALPNGLPDLHVGVISTDMGAGPQHTAGCTATGKAGQLQSSPRGDCADTTLAPGRRSSRPPGGCEISRRRSRRSCNASSRSARAAAASPNRWRR